MPLTVDGDDKTPHPASPGRPAHELGKMPVVVASDDVITASCFPCPSQYMLQLGQCLRLLAVLM